MTTAIIMIHYGPLANTKKCLAELRKKIGNNRLVLINNSVEDARSLTSIIPDSIYIDNRRNLGFAKAVNQGIERAKRIPGVDFYLLMNNDLEFSFGSLDTLKRIFIDKKMAGIVSPILHHGGNLYDWGGSYNKWTGMVKHRNFEQKPKTVLNVTHVAGAAMLIKRGVVDKIGLFDERFFLYYEDLDYCLRAQSAGFTIHISPEVVAEHAVSSGSALLRRTFAQWKSHLKFSFKYFPVRAMPSAIVFDLIYYPLILLKILIFRQK